MKVQKDERVDKRTRARELVMQALYSLDVQGDAAFDCVTEFLAESGADEQTRRIAAEWTRGAWGDAAACDELIKSAAIKWQFQRLSPVDRSILRLAVYQLARCPGIPPKVAINEAIELAKKFSTEKAPGFINGVLDTIHRKLTEQRHGG